MASPEPSGPASFAKRHSSAGVVGEGATASEVLLPGFFPSRRGAVDSAVQSIAEGDRLLPYCGSDLGVNGALQISVALKKKADVEGVLGVVDVNLQGANICAEGCSKISSALGKQTHMQYLRRLDLSSNKVGDEGALSLAQRLKPGDVLLTLVLSDNNISDSGVKAIAKAVQFQSGLRELRLAENQIHPKGAVSLAKTLLKHAALQTLDLNGNHIGDRGAVALIQAMQRSVEKPPPPPTPELEPHPTLTGVRLQVVGPAMLPRYRDHRSVGQPPPRGSVETRGGRDIPGGPGDTKLVGTRGLRALHLNHCGLFDKTAEALADALMSCRDGPLRELFLAQNDITDKGGCKLALCLEVHKVLRILDLRGNRMGDVSAFSFVSMLSRMPRADMSIVFSGNRPAGRLVGDESRFEVERQERFDDKALADLARPAKTVRSLSERGVTLGRLLRFYESEVAAGRIDELTTTTSEVATSIIAPETKEFWNSYSVYFNKPMPDVYVIHAKGGLFRDLLMAIARHATGILNPILDVNHSMWDNRFPHAMKRAYWIDCFSQDQHLPLPQFDARCENDKFDLVMDLIHLRCGEFILALDGAYTPLTSLHCLSEVYHCLFRRVPLSIHFGKHVPFPRARRGWCLDQAVRGLTEQVPEPKELDVLRAVLGAKSIEDNESIVPRKIWSEIPIHVGATLKISLETMIAAKFQADRTIMPLDLLFELEMLEMELQREEVQAAITIQRVQRGIWGRKIYAELVRLRREAMANRLQRWWRATPQRRKFLYIKRACALIQHWWREPPFKLQTRNMGFARAAYKARLAASRERLKALLECALEYGTPGCIRVVGLGCRAGLIAFKVADALDSQLSLSANTAVAPAKRGVRA